MADLTMTTFDAALKDLYTDQRVLNLVYRDSPLLAILPKNTNWGGRRQPIPVQDGVVKGASATFATAQTNANPGNYDAFYVDSVADYAVATIQGKVMRASATDVMAFLRAAKVEVDGALRILSRRLSHRIYADGFNTIGRIASITNASPSVITLGSGLAATAVADPEVVVHFERGMWLVAASANAAGTVRSSPARSQIVKVDRDLGTLTMDADLVGDWVANDFLSIEGDRSSSASVRTGIAGLSAWCPTTAPTTGDSFFGLDRSVDTTRLAGVRFDAATVPISVEEALIKACWRGRREGASYTHCVLNPVKMAELIISQGDKARYETIPSPDAPAIGTRAMLLMTPTGEIRVMADENCQSLLGWLFDIKALKVCSMGQCPGILEHDGMRLLRVSNSDSVEVRAGYYANMTCDDPRSLCVIQFAA